MGEDNVIDFDKHRKEEEVGDDILGKNFPFTDLGRGRYFVHINGHSIRYCKNEKNWYCWDGARWAVDERGKVQSIAQDLPMRVHEVASRITDQDKRKKQGEYARDLETKKMRDIIIKEAESLDPVPILSDDFDQHKRLLNTPTGTAILEANGDVIYPEVKPNDPADLITQITRGSFDIMADCPLFKGFLNEILQDNTELINYVQKVLGYCLVGGNPERLLFFLIGIRRNGKSTLLETIAHVLGDYAETMSIDILTNKRSPRYGLADLKNKRFVTSSEAEDDQKISVSLVKLIAGGSDKLPARQIYAKEERWIPQFAVFIATNEKPFIKDDPATWDRLRIIPFDYVIPEEQKDINLGDKLKAEKDGILLWLLEGCVKYQKEGLTSPPEVKSATEEYQAEMSAIADFWNDETIDNEMALTSTKDLYTSYKNWCIVNNEDAMSQTRFGLKLGEKGYTKEKIGKIFWRGIGLRSNITEEDS